MVGRHGARGYVIHVLETIFLAFRWRLLLYGADRRVCSGQQRGWNIGGCKTVRNGDRNANWWKLRDDCNCTSWLGSVDTFSKQKQSGSNCAQTASKGSLWRCEERRKEKREDKGEKQEGKRAGECGRETALLGVEGEETALEGG